MSGFRKSGHIFTIDEYSIRIMQYIMPYSMHMQLTALLEHIDALLKYECLLYGFVAVCLTLN